MERVDRSSSPHDTAYELGIHHLPFLEARTGVGWGPKLEVGFLLAAVT